MPARVLRPWEVLERDIQDLKITSDKGNRYLLVVVDRASNFLTAYHGGYRRESQTAGAPPHLRLALLDPVRPWWRLRR